MNVKRNNEKIQEMIDFSKKKSHFFTNDNKLHLTRHIYSFLNIRDRIRFIKVNRLFSSFLTSKTSLKYLPKLKQEIKAVFSKNASLHSLLYKEGKVLVDFISNFCNENGGENIRIYCFTYLGYLLNKQFLENEDLTKFITEVNIHNSGLYKKGADILSLILCNNHSLTRMILPNNSIGGKGFRQLFQSISNITSLHELDLSGNFLEKQEIMVLSRFLQLQIEMKTLKLYNCMIKDEGMILLGNSITNMKNLESLYLGSNLLTTRGLEILIKCIKQNENLNLIDLKENVIKSFEILSEYICNQKRLEYLDLSMNLCAPKLAEFGDCFSKTKSLITLYLNNCNIDNFSEFLENICSNTSLKSINLSYNIPKDCDNVYYSLRKLLEDNKTLEEITWFKGIDDEMIKKLKDFKEKKELNTKLKIHYISSDKPKLVDFS